jgi:osmotically-inducible protein OsmY
MKPLIRDGADIMIRTAVAILVLAVLGLFGYFYVSDKGNDDAGDKAKRALYQAGDVVADKGLETAVKVRLTASIGFDASRFLHVYNNDGRVLIYGLVPDEVSQEQIVKQAEQVPGVKSAEVMLLSRPAYLTSDKSEASEEQTEGG